MTPLKKLCEQCIRDGQPVRPYHLCCARCRDRIDALLRDVMSAERTAPESCGDAVVPFAPARGPVVPFHPLQAAVTDSGAVRIRRDGYQGRTALRRRDAFDRMQDQASRRRGPRGDGAAPDLFSAGQVSVARDYAALVERCAGAGVKCASLDGSGGAGAGDGGWIVAVMADLQLLRALRARIGAVVILSPRGAASHADRGRRVMTARDAVDAVCVGDLTIGQLLQKFGWPANGVCIKKTRAGLCAALDRMQGFRDR